MRLIDADKLKAHYSWWKGGTREMTMDEAKSDFDTIVDLQPTVDVEPIEVRTAYEQKAYNEGYADGMAQCVTDFDLVSVVRCKDCKYWRRFAKEDADGGCSLLEINEGRKPNDYCSQAERKDKVEDEL